MQTKSPNASISPLRTHKSLDQSLLSLSLDSPLGEKPHNFGDSGIRRSSSSMASFSGIIGDYIGFESCLDLKDNEDILVPFSPKKEECFSSTSYQSCSWTKRGAEKKREFPPPITMLAHTENCSSHMPWVLKRHYTCDGRLVLTGEKVRYHEYLQAHRSNGRLTLHLVPLDNINDEYQDQDSPVAGGEEDNIDKDVEEVNENGGGSEDDDDCCFADNIDDDENNMEVEVKVEDVCEDQRVPSPGGGGGKCSNYKSVTSPSTCIFGLPVPAMRPIHS